MGTLSSQLLFFFIGQILQSFPWSAVKFPLFPLKVARLQQRSSETINGPKEGTPYQSNRGQGTLNSSLSPLFLFQRFTKLWVTPTHTKKDRFSLFLPQTHLVNEHITLNMLPICRQPFCSSAQCKSAVLLQPVTKCCSTQLTLLGNTSMRMLIPLNVWVCVCVAWV